MSIIIWPQYIIQAEYLTLLISGYTPHRYAFIACFSVVLFSRVGFVVVRTFFFFFFRTDTGTYYKVPVLVKMLPAGPYDLLPFFYDPMGWDPHIYLLHTIPPESRSRDRTGTSPLRSCTNVPVLYDTPLRYRYDVQYDIVYKCNIYVQICAHACPHYVLYIYIYKII